MFNHHGSLIIVGAALALLATLGPVGAEATRQQIDLAGTWEMLPVDHDDLSRLPGADASWQAFALPGIWSDRGQHHSTFWRKQVEVPADWAGRLARLQFGAGFFLLKVYVNGQYAGEHLGGDIHFQVEVTGQLQPGATNKILLAMTDYEKAAYRDGQPIMAWTSNWIGNRTMVTGTGVTQYLRLVSLPRVHIEDIFVKTFVSRARLEAEVEIVNAFAQSQEIVVSGEAYDEQGVARRFGSTQLYLEPGDTRTSWVAGSWPEAHLWWPHDPHLYFLRVKLATPQGEILDETEVRFGFREITIRGNQFYLNGLRLSLRGESFCRYGNLKFSDPAEARAILEFYLQEHHVNLLRMHPDLWDEAMLNAADELGLMLLSQSNLGQRIPFSNREFWANELRLWRQWVRQSRNHPSVIIWSVDNENSFTGGMPNLNAPTVPGLIEMIRLTKELDPTRPVTSTHNYDLRGYSDCWDGPPGWCFARGRNLLHDLREYRSYYYDLPGTWDRTRPLVSDEWNEGMGLHPASIWLGGEAYVAYGGPEPRSDVRSWSARYVQALSNYFGVAEQRKMEVPLLASFGDRFTYQDPATGHFIDPDPALIELAQRNYPPVAIFPQEWFANYWGGELWEPAFEVFNDNFHPLTARLWWRLSLERSGAEIAHGAQQLELPPASHQPVTLRAQLPQVLEPTSLALEVRLSQRGEVLYKDRLEYAILPRPDFSALDSMQTLGSLATLESLAQLGLALEPLSAPAQADPRRPLLMAPEVLAGLTQPEWQALEDYVRQGGRLLCLEQLALPGEYATVFGSVELRLSGRALEIAHLRDKLNPAFAGLARRNLRWWRPDYFVCNNAFWRPETGNFTPLMDAGAHIYDAPRQGLVFVPLLQVRTGAGLAIFSQLDLVSRLEVSPAARRLLHRLLQAVRAPTVPLRPALKGAGLETLSALGVETIPLRAESFSAVGPSGAVLLDAKAAEFADVMAQHGVQLAAAVRQGARVLIHCLTPETAPAVSEAFGVDLSVEEAPYSGLRLHQLHPLVRGLSNFDVYWRNTRDLCRVTAMELIIEHQVTTTAPGAVALAEPGGLLLIPQGEGFLVLDQIGWDRSDLADAYVAARAQELACMLMTNLDIALEPTSEASLWLRDWLIVGPFSQSLDTDLLGGEAGYAAVEGQVVAEQTWLRRELDIEGNPGDNLNQALTGPVADPRLAREAGGQFTHCFAYAQTYVHSPVEQEVVLSGGADDHLILWLNSEKIFDKMLGGYREADFTLTTRLQAGSNCFLAKIGQGLGFWGFAIKITGAESVTCSIAP